MLLALFMAVLSFCKLVFAGRLLIRSGKCTSAKDVVNRIGFRLTVVLGLFVGCFLNWGIDYPIPPHYEVTGFPLPIIIINSADENRVYEGLPALSLTIVGNALMVAALFGLLFWRRLPRKMEAR